MYAYRQGNYAGAEHEFAQLAASPEASAVHFYYLGLAQARLGRDAEAEKSFHRGWALERESRPPPAVVDAAFERLSRPERELVNRYRQP
jgi:Tfp pilus assembly protein PilF